MCNLNASLFDLETYKLNILLKGMITTWKLHEILKSSGIISKSDRNRLRGIVCQFCGGSLSCSLFLGRCSGSYYGIITPFSLFHKRSRIIGAL